MSYSSSLLLFLFVEHESALAFGPAQLRLASAQQIADTAGFLESQRAAHFAETLQDDRAVCVRRLTRLPGEFLRLICFGGGQVFPGHGIGDVNRLALAVPINLKPAALQGIISRTIRLLWKARLSRPEAL